MHWSFVLQPASIRSTGLLARVGKRVSLVSGAVETHQILFYRNLQNGVTSRQIVIEPDVISVGPRPGPLARQCNSNCGRDEFGRGVSGTCRGYKRVLKFSP